MKIDITDDQKQVIRRALKARKRQATADFNRLRNDSDLWYLAKHAMKEFDISVDLLDNTFPNDPPEPKKG